MNTADRIGEFAKVIENYQDPQTLVDKVLSTIDNEHETFDDATRRKCFDLLGEAEKKIRRRTDEKKEWWLSEIYMRKARCGRGIIDRKREYACWKDASSYAMQAGNHEMRLHAGLELGFGFVEFSSSLRDILEIQMDCIRAICTGGVATSSRLRIIGINLFDFWRQLEYRRLSEHDLKAKQYIIDSAKSLSSAGFDAEAAAPLMIMLISKVYDFEDPALEWAKMEAGILFMPVPEEVQRKLEKS